MNTFNKEFVNQAIEDGISKEEILEQIYEGLQNARLEEMDGSDFQEGLSEAGRLQELYEDLQNEIIEEWSNKS